jgi:hypothetical protein
MHGRSQLAAQVPNGGLAEGKTMPIHDSAIGKSNAPSLDSLANLHTIFKGERE